MMNVGYTANAKSKVPMKKLYSGLISSEEVKVFFKILVKITELWYSKCIHHGKSARVLIRISSYYKHKFVIMGLLCIFEF